MELMGRDPLRSPFPKVWILSRAMLRLDGSGSIGSTLLPVVAFVVQWNLFLSSSGVRSGMVSRRFRGAMEEENHAYLQSWWCAFVDRLLFPLCACTFSAALTNAMVSSPLPLLTLSFLHEDVPFLRGSSCGDDALFTSFSPPLERVFPSHGNPTASSSHARTSSSSHTRPEIDRQSGGVRLGERP